MAYIISLMDNTALLNIRFLKSNYLALSNIKCSQETLLDKAGRLGQPNYHSYPFDFYSFQFHINLIRFFNVPNHKLRLNVGLPIM